VSSGMNDVCAAALLALSGAAHAFNRAAAEPLRMLGDALLERVSGKRRDDRATARQNAKQRADQRAATDGAPRRLSGQAASA